MQKSKIAKIMQNYAKIMQNYAKIMQNYAKMQKCKKMQKICKIMQKSRLRPGPVGGLTAPPKPPAVFSHACGVRFGH